MTRIIEQLRAAGETITDAELARVSPLAFSHIMPHGTSFTRPTPLENPGERHGPLHPLVVDAASDV